MTWKHFPHYRSFVRGIPWSPVVPPYKEPVMILFLCCPPERAFERSQVAGYHNAHVTSL